MARRRMTFLFLWLTLLVAVVFCGAATGQPLNSQILVGQAGAAGRLAAVRFADTADHWARVPVMRLAAQGIISGRGDGRFDPESPVTRLEALNLLGRAAGWESAASGAGQNGQGTGYLPAAAQKFLTTKEQAYTFADWQAPAARQEVAAWVGRALGLTPAGTAFLPVLASFQDGGEVDGELAPMVEAVLKEGLMAGVQAGVFAPRRAMTRAEMAALLDRLDGRLAPLRGASRLEGQVVEREENWQDGGRRVLNFRVATFAGSFVNLTVEVGSDGVSGADFLLYKNAILTLGRELMVGDTVKLYLQGDKVLYAEAAPPPFNPGGGTTPGYGTTPAYNPAVVRTVNGYLRERKGDQLVVVDGAGNETELTFTETTAVSRSGRLLLSDDLKIGDRLKVQVDGRGRALSIMVGNTTGRLDKVLRGKIDRFNPLDGRIVLRDTAEFFYGRWLTEEPIKTLRLSRETGTFATGAGGLLEATASMGGRGTDVLAVLENGTDTAVGLAGSGASLGLYEGTIQNLYVGSSELFLEGRDAPLLFTPETLFIKNGQRVAAADFKDGDYVFMVAAGPDNPRLLLVYGADFLPPSWRLYRGEIDEVTREGFELDDVYVLGYGSTGPFDWYETEENKEFKLDWEPIIMGQDGEMSRDAFTAGRFTGDYAGYDAFVLARGETAFGLLCLPRDQIGPTMTSLGRLQSFDRGRETVTLVAVRDWSEGRGRWQDREEALTLTAGRVLVFKDRKVATAEDLMPGAAFYVVHDGRQALAMLAAD